MAGLGRGSRFPTLDQRGLRERGFAAEVIGARMRMRGLPGLVFRIDAIGVVSVLGENGGTLSRRGPPMRRLRLRFAAQSAMVADVELLLDEVEALYCAGPAGGSGVPGG